MAQIVKRTLGDGRTVQYDGRTRIGGRVVTRTFRRRKDADAYASTTEADKFRGVARDRRSSRGAQTWRSPRTIGSIRVASWIPKGMSCPGGPIPEVATRRANAGSC